MNVSVEYKIFSLIKLTFKRKVPQSYSDLSAKQMLNVARVLLKHTEFKAQIEANSNLAHHIQQASVLDFMLVEIIYNIPRWIMKKLTPYHIFMLIDKVGFVGQAKQSNRFMITKMADGVAPNPKLEGMPFGQFIFTDTYFSNWVEMIEKVESNEITQDEADMVLNKFLAALYRQNGKPFAYENIAPRAKKFQNVGYDLKYAAILNYQMVRHWLTVAYPLVFPVKNKPDGPATVQRSASMIDMFDAIVGDDIVNSDRYAMLPLNTVLRQMNRKIKEYYKSKH